MGTALEAGDTLYYPTIFLEIRYKDSRMAPRMVQVGEEI